MDSHLYLKIALNERMFQLRKLYASAFPQLARVIADVSEWTHKSGIWLLCCLGDWLIIVEWVCHLLEYQGLLPWLCQDLGIVINMEKSNLELYQQGPASQDTGRHHPRKDLSHGLSDCHILRYGKQVSPSSVSTSKVVASDSRPQGLT